VAGALAAVVALAGCGPAGAGPGGAGSGRAATAGGGCADPVPVPARRLAALPEALELHKSGTVTKVTTAPRYVSAEAVAEGTLDRLYEGFPGTLSGAGYAVVAKEYEGIEADYFFSGPRGESGSVKLIEGPCEGQVTIQLTISSR
jgi:hypothetical protein